MSTMTPAEIVSELDKHIIGQNNAKKAVAVALRNRWRRQQVADPLRQEITPKNILMIGPTGVGKTEIARRLAKLADAPFIKIEATKFTEVGYVGRDVDSIVRDLIEISVKQTREAEMRKVRSKASTRPRTAFSTSCCRSRARSASARTPIMRTTTTTRRARRSASACAKASSTTRTSNSTSSSRRWAWTSCRRPAWKR